MDTNGKKLINNLSEDYCSFEVSKLLKEKGFKVGTREKYIVSNTKYYKEGTLFTPSDELDQTACENHGVPDRKMIDAPTHALAIKWIRENFDIYIYTYPDFEDADKPETFCISVDITTIYHNDKSIGYNTRGVPPFKFKNPEEATEAALLYTLINLIQ